MSQQFRIDSESLRDKVNNLLPSQNRGSIGVDLTGSTTIIPIVDLTETAEGSNLRQDLQTSFGLNSTFLQSSGATTTFINTTGYYRLLGSYRSNGTTSTVGIIRITDGTTTNNILRYSASATSTVYDFDIVIFLKAGTSCEVSTNANAQINVVSRQIADVNGNLINPS
tara:strand:- start:194 stop:697 length:504 start_codon:yes stop_codon:yes gene_type:complete